MEWVLTMVIGVFAAATILLSCQVIAMILTGMILVLNPAITAVIMSSWVGALSAFIGSSYYKKKSKS